MILSWTKNGWADYLYWQTADRSMTKRVNALVLETMRSPFTGIGKPEPLKGDYAGCWSRRIDSEHRLIYRVSGVGDGQTLLIVACRHHYG